MGKKMDSSEDQKIFIGLKPVRTVIEAK